MKWYFEVLRKYSEFDGRASRREFWMFFLYHFLILVLLSMLATQWSSAPGAYLDVVYSVMVMIPMVAVTVRRLHDTGRTGWWALLGLVPIASFFLVVLLCFRGDPKGNAHGPNPLQSVE